MPLRVHGRFLLDNTVIYLRKNIFQPYRMFFAACMWSIWSPATAVARVRFWVKFLSGRAGSGDATRSGDPARREAETAKDCPKAPAPYAPGCSRSAGETDHPKAWQRFAPGAQRYRKPPSSRIRQCCNAERPLVFVAVTDSVGDYFTEDGASKLKFAGNCKAVAHIHSRESAQEREFNFTDLQAQSAEA